MADVVCCLGPLGFLRLWIKNVLVLWRAIVFIQCLRNTRTELSLFLSDSVSSCRFLGRASNRRMNVSSQNLRCLKHLLKIVTFSVVPLACGSSGCTPISAQTCLNSRAAHANAFPWNEGWTLNSCSFVDKRPGHMRWLVYTSTVYIPQCLIVMFLFTLSHYDRDYSISLCWLVALKASLYHLKVPGCTYMYVLMVITQVEPFPSFRADLTKYGL